MKSAFVICGYPRSRTMWLSRFLTIPGTSYCDHEAMEFAGSPQEFWENAELHAPGEVIYGDSDSASIYVLRAILAEQPLTRVVWVNRNIVEVAKSMEAAGMPLAEKVLNDLITMHYLYQDCFDMVVDFEALNCGAICREVFEFCLPGVAWDWGRWGMMASQKICYSKENPMPAKSCAKFLPWVEREIAALREERTIL